MLPNYDKEAGRYWSSFFHRSRRLLDDQPVPTQDPPSTIAAKEGHCHIGTNLLVAPEENNMNLQEDNPDQSWTIMLGLGRFSIGEKPSPSCIFSLCIITTTTTTVVVEVIVIVTLTVTVMMTMTN